MLHRWSGHLPPPDPDLHQVRRRDVRDVRSVEVRGGVHAFVQVLLLDIRMSIDVDDADLFRGARGDAPDRGEPDGVVAAKD